MAYLVSLPPAAGVFAVVLPRLLHLGHNLLMRQAALSPESTTPLHQLGGRTPAPGATPALEAEGCV